MATKVLGENKIGSNEKGEADDGQAHPMSSLRAPSPLSSRCHVITPRLHTGTSRRVTRTGSTHLSQIACAMATADTIKSIAVEAHFIH